MANEKRVRRNFMSGQMTTALTAASVTATDPSFAKLGLVDSTNHMALTFEDLAANTYEVMYVLAHAVNSNTVTLRRAQEGTTAVPWAIQSKWVHAPTVRDFIGVGNNDQKQLASGQSYPATTYTLVGTRNITLPAYAGDLIQVFQSVEVKVGDFTFDYFTLVGGKKTSQFSKTVTSVSAYTGYPLPGMFLNRPSVYAYSQLDGHDRQHYVTGYVSQTGSVFYQAQAADIVNNTITIGWYCTGKPEGNSTATSNTVYNQFYTNDGAGFIQGSATSTGNTVLNQLGVSVWSAMNHGPRLSR